MRKRLSEAHKQNISKALKGQRRTLGTRKLMSEKKHEYWDRVRYEQEWIDAF